MITDTEYRSQYGINPAGSEYLFAIGASVVLVREGKTGKVSMQTTVNVGAIEVTGGVDRNAYEVQVESDGAVDVRFCYEEGPGCHMQPIDLRYCQNVLERVSARPLDFGSQSGATGLWFVRL